METWIGTPEYHAYKSIEERFREPRWKRTAHRTGSAVVAAIAAILLLGR